MAVPNIDGVLVQWGDRLFYPGNRSVRAGDPPRLTGSGAQRRAASIRQRIEATLRRAPQVMVKVTGGGRNMKTIAAHFRYISKHGRLELEDERGEVMKGRGTLRDLVEEWRYSGSAIDEAPQPGQRREALNIMLSMPRGTDPLLLQKAAREFAQAELHGHKHVMVLHDHQANPHVHISVRVESRSGRRLSPRKVDLHRWRETFAEKLRGYGIEAEATRQATRGQRRNYDDIWQVKARQDGRLMRGKPETKSGAKANLSRGEAREAWMQIGRAMAESGEAADLRLAKEIAQFLVQPATVASSSAARVQQGPDVKGGEPDLKQGR